VSSALSLFTARYLSPDGDQHCDDHDGSGGMRKSGYEVDDAGDASNTEIGHVAYLPSRTSVAITPLCDLAEPGDFLWGSGNLGERTLAESGLSVRTLATAMPNQLGLPCESCDHCPVQPAAEIALTRGLSRRRAEKRHSLPSSLSRLTYGHTDSI
jgi:hypothetical protein